MKILFVISGLFDAGGAERVLTIMANYWAEKGHDVIIANFDDGEQPTFYPLSEKVKREAIDLMCYPSRVFAAIANNYRRIKRLNCLFKKTKPDVIISFLTNTNITTLLASRGTGLPVIVSERNHPAYSSIDPIRKKLRSWLYPKADAVVCQTEGILNYYQPLLGNNGVIIPNPVAYADPSPSPPEIPLPDGRLLLAAGNLSSSKIYQKGFDLIIPIFSTLANQHRDWHLLILGDGEQRGLLLQKVKEFNLADRIHLPGNVNNIHSIYKCADLFVLSSRYEGFPNVLCEAMASGLPAVSFDCPTGPSEIIRDGIDGILVTLEDTEKLKESLDQLMSNTSTRESMGEKASDVAERFSINKVMDKWEELLNNVNDKCCR